jgi:hypothetical protein
MLMYNDELPLYDFYTIAEVKRRVGQQRFSNNIIIRVYFETECNFSEDEAAIEYAKFEAKHLKDGVETPIKINLKDSTGLYFYVKTGLGATIQ